jgi:steroid delta-isomerase-like uncharacterized protein
MRVDTGEAPMPDLNVPFNEMNVEQFQAHFDQRSVNTHDADAVAQWFAPDGIQRQVPTAEVARGRDAVRERVEALFRAFPDFHVRVRDLFTAGDRTCVECTSTGTHEGDFAGIPATGRKVEVDTCYVFRWNADGLVQEETIYFDSATILMQLGVLPGGS